VPPGHMAPSHSAPRLVVAAMGNDPSNQSHQAEAEVFPEDARELLRTLTNSLRWPLNASEKRLLILLLCARLAKALAQPQMQGAAPSPQFQHKHQRCGFTGPEPCRCLRDKTEGGALMQAQPFSRIANLMIRMGVPIVPVAPRGKNPLPSQWQEKASTDVSVIDAWIGEYGDDINCGSVAAPDGYWYLDCDTPDLAPLIEQETGKNLPRTFTVKTSKGRHYYWRQSEASRAMGNCANHTAPYEFDAQQNRRQVISPGSTHPSGTVYEIVDDSNIAEAPDWLCDWIKQHDQNKAKPNGAYGHPVSEDFDFDEFCDHYGIEYYGDTGWLTTPICPFAGHEHEQSKQTGFYYDGSIFGFHCFAGGCGDPSIGDLIRKLNEDHEPYRGVIWEQEDNFEDIDFLKGTGESDASAAEDNDRIDGDEFVYIEPQPPPVTEWVTVVNRYGEVRYIQKPVLTPVNVPDAQPEANEDAENLEMPESAMYGYLAELAKLMKMPFGLAYPALLGCYSVIPDEDELQRTRINFYVALLAVVGGGKNVAIKRAREILDLNREYWMLTEPGGDKQLLGLIGDTVVKLKGRPPERIPGPRKMLIISNEMNTVVKKMGISNSSLASTLTDLWDENRKVSPGSGTIPTHNVNCRLSWIGGVPIDKDSPEEFAETFGRETGNGLMSRLVFGYSGVKFNYKRWEPPLNTVKAAQCVVTELDMERVKAECKDKYKGTTEDEGVAELAALREVDPTLPEHLEKQIDEWEPENGDARTKYHLHKLIMLTSHANKDREVTQECVNAAMEFMRWQVRIKEVFKIGIAPQHSLEAQFAEACLSALERKRIDSNEKAISWTRLGHDLKWSKKFSPRNVAQGIQNLVTAGELQFHTDEVQDSNSKITVKTSKYRIYLRKWDKE
jgi:hypothetical protein